MLRSWPGELHARRRPVEEAALELQREAVLDQRSPGVGLEALRAPEVAVPLDGTVQRGLPAPFLLAPPRDDVHDSPQGIRSVEGRHRDPDHLDPLDHGEGGKEHDTRIVEGVRRDRARKVLPPPVDEGQGVLGGKPPKADRPVPGLVAACIRAIDVHPPESGAAARQRSGPGSP